MLCMSYIKNMELSDQLYQAMEQELQAMERSLGYRRRLLPHRHYLVHDTSHGTPSQRQREHTQSRLHQAIDSVYDRQFQKALQNSEVSEVKPSLERRVKKRMLKSSASLLQRIADEKIMEEMNTGGFTKIRGKGEPIRNEPATHVLDNLDEKLNKVLISAGCAPDWIALDKEIREEISKLKADVKETWHRCNSMESVKEDRWHEHRGRFSDRIKRINSKIRKLNFDVPSLQMQRVLLQCDSFVDRVTSEVDTTAPCHGVETGNRLCGESEVQSDDVRTHSTSRNEFSVAGRVMSWVSSVITQYSGTVCIGVAMVFVFLVFK